MRLLEREAALADLTAALDEARAGAGAVAMVSGEAGVGKTTLLRAFAGEADAARTLIGGCDDLARPRALGPFLEIADQVPRLLRRLEGEPVDAPRAVLDELRRDGPTLCVVEDAHWADEATLDVITHVARRVEDLPALLVISFRDDEVPPDHPLRRALAAAPAARTRRIALAPLSPAADEAIRLLEEGPPGRELAMALSNRSQLAMLAQHNQEAISWGERAIALAHELGDVETLVHAQNNLGTALLQASLGGDARDAAIRGQALLDESAARAMEAGLDEHACRAFVNSAWQAHAEGRHADARRIAEQGMAYAREREQVSFVEYLTALDALIDLATGEWGAAEATAAELVAIPTLRQTVARIPALEVLGLIHARCGEPDAGELLDPAWRFAEVTRELQRIRPIACARAELAWLAGDLDAVDAATGDAYDLALRVGNRWDVGALALWRHRAGLLDEAPQGLPAPVALEMVGDPRSAAAAWRDLGVTYHAALALMQAGDSDSLLEAITILDGLGATAVADLARDLARRTGAPRVPRGPRASTRENPLGLTGRQMQVLELLAQGLSNGQIAERLVVSPKTVEHHVAAVLDKLGAANRGEAVTAARNLRVPLNSQS